MGITYIVCKAVCKVIIAVFFRLRVNGRENVPINGPVILCSNHTSNLDPVVIAVVLKRLPNFVAKKELFKNPVLGFLLNKFDCIKVDRENADMSTFRESVDRLKDGKCLGIFAQGGRVKPGESKSAKAGVALFAVKSGAPVIPVAVTSSFKIFSKIELTFGEPIPFDSYIGKKVRSDELNEIADGIMNKINELIIEQKS